jgi:hypothetical protein
MAGEHLVMFFVGHYHNIKIKQAGNSWELSRFPAQFSTFTRPKGRLLK